MDFNRIFCIMPSTFTNEAQVQYMQTHIHTIIKMTHVFYLFIFSLLWKFIFDIKIEKLNRRNWRLNSCIRLNKMSLNIFFSSFIPLSTAYKNVTSQVTSFKSVKSLWIEMKASHKHTMYGAPIDSVRGINKLFYITLKCILLKEKKSKRKQQIFKVESDKSKIT